LLLLKVVLRTEARTVHKLQVVLLSM
jgi:hypothetical protein